MSNKTLQELVSTLEKRDFKGSLKEAPLWKDLEFLSDSLEVEEEDSTTYNLEEFDDMESYIDYLESYDEGDTTQDEVFSQIYPLNLTLNNESDIRVSSTELRVIDTLPEELRDLGPEEFSFDVQALSIVEPKVSTIKVSSFWSARTKNLSFLGFNRLPFTFDQVITITAGNKALNTRTIYRTTSRTQKKDVINIGNLEPDTYTVTLSLEVEGVNKANAQKTITLTEHKEKKVLNYD